MSKCGACAKFASPTGDATCSKCKAIFHKLCVSLNTTKAVPKQWMCPVCLSKVPKFDNTNTPVKSNYVEDTQETTKNIELVLNDNETKIKELLDQKEQVSLTKVLEHMKLFFNEMQALRETITTFSADLRELRADIISCKNSTDLVVERIVKVEERIIINENNYDKQIQELQSEVKVLKQNINSRDQELFMNDLEINGVPEQTGENPFHLVHTLAVKLGSPLEEVDVVDVHRAGPRRLVATDAGGAHLRPRTLVLRLARRVPRDRLLQAARTRRNLTTADMSLQGDCTRVYINERLTIENKKILRRAKEEISQHGWKYVWVKDGRILIRQNEGSKVHRILKEEDITTVFGSQRQNANVAS